MIINCFITFMRDSTLIIPPLPQNLAPGRGVIHEKCQCKVIVRLFVAYRFFIAYIDTFF